MAGPTAGPSAPAEPAGAVAAPAVVRAARPVVGVLALQGDVAEHLRALTAAGAEAAAVRRPGELDRLDGLVLPGGESTTIGMLCARFGLLEPIAALARRGTPVLGTCAGAILLAREARGRDGRRCEQPLVGVMDLAARRNAFGRQVDSCEVDLPWSADRRPLRAALIRGPWLEDLGEGVEPLAHLDAPGPGGGRAVARVVLARQGGLLAAAFHPELTGEDRLHRLLVGMADERRR